VASVLIILLGLLWKQTANQYYQDLTQPFFLRNSVTAQFLAEKLSPNDVLIYLGLRRASLEYALRQRGLSPAIAISFPSELDVHFSWGSVSDTMNHRENLVTECEVLMQKLYRGDEENQQIWVATAGDDQLSRLFWEIMKRKFAINQNESSPQVGLFRLMRKPPDF
jgi:hypothetical protein